ncbi:M64 family metallopeptidase [Dyadobacter aurulentus]|uniref:M64 family metallopeptidase n=1 Tax=Dyadobacter sp. UC 10 TaxID=2605428 RepID=UPI0011F1A328|nr:M64 family metallopeptidase [Dyadobacter sp. UC 10]KAA0993128.1 T9SS type A sorting domain-containing protein [Dyadobacter sp. UC 10]
MKKNFTTLCLSIFAAQAFAQNFSVDTLYKTGPLINRINIVILGDGFTEAELPEFRKEAKKFADFFLGYAPYNRYRSYFNFFAISTPSEESGVSNPGNAPDAYPQQPVGMKKTFYSASFGSAIHRLVTIDYGVAYNVLAANLPDYDLIVVLVNTTYYGGSGGSVAVHTLNESANLIGVHEIGHTFASLSDEYWAGPQFGREAANMTAISDPGNVRWKNWLDAEGIGVYRHGSDGEAANWHKPANGTCLMEYLDQQFCVVCREATTERILNVVNPIEQVAPDTVEAFFLDKPTKFSVQLLEPNPNSLSIDWKLNGKVIASGTNEVTMGPVGLATGDKITAVIVDSTSLSRSDLVRASRVRTVEWRLETNLPARFSVEASADSVCENALVTLRATGCDGAVSWSTGASGDTVVISALQTSKFTATCQSTGQSAGLTINVAPSPLAFATNTGPYFQGATIDLRAEGGATYEWSGPRDFTATTQTVSIPEAQVTHKGTYTVKASNQFGCSDTASTNVVVEPILAVEDPANSWVRVSPNPARDYIKIETGFNGNSELVLTNAAGQIIATKTFSRETEVRINAASGIYIYKITNAEKEFSGKVIIE